SRRDALTDPIAGSLTFYEKEAWAVHMIRKQVGDVAYRRGVVQFLEKYSFRNAGIDDFIREMEQAGGTDLDPYKQQWLQSREFPYLEAKETLVAESKDLERFIKLQEELIATNTDTETVLRSYWDATRSAPFRANIITAYYPSLSDNFLGKALASGNPMIRQALAISAGQIPLGLKEGFESLLDDESYLTLEQALYKLWIYFPSDRIGYLNRTENITGFPDKNIRVLWLALALLTKDFEPQKSGEYYKELGGYTGAEYPFEVRMNTFRFLKDAIGFSDRNLLDLIQASQHRSWQFRKFAGTLLDQLLEEGEYRGRIKKLLGKLNESELRYMNNKLKTR
ncbi:MAG TPA: hypothetical protein VLZ54_06595, partial [Arenibacter sp.]|nr:hypothetical protein [Arenibacter sp.]